MQRRRFFLGSLALHVGLLWAISQWHGNALVDATVRANTPQIEASAQAAERHGMRRHVDSLKVMKELIERIDHAQQPSDPSRQVSTDDAFDIKRGATPTSHGRKTPPVVLTPQEMLDQARSLRDSIQKIEQAARAKEMTKLLKMSPQQALERVQYQAQEKAKAEFAMDPTQLQTNEQVAQALERYEQQAREAVQSRQQLAEHQANGTSLTQAGTPGSASQAAQGLKPKNHGDAGTGSGSGNGTEGRSRIAAGRLFDTRHSEVIDLNPRRYDAPLKPIPIDVANLRLGYGNVLGTGGGFANRVFVDRWYVIGPFTAPDPSSMQKIYPPELLVDLDAVYLGKARRVLRWQYVSSTLYPLVPPDKAEQAMYYGYTELSSDKNRDVWMAFGSDDDAKAWVNDAVVWTSGNQAKRWYTPGGFRSLKQDVQNANLIEERRLVHLHKGRNTILFKLYNNPLDVFFSLVIEPGPEHD